MVEAPTCYPNKLFLVHVPVTVSVLYPYHTVPYSTILYRTEPHRTIHIYLNTFHGIRVLMKTPAPNMALNTLTWRTLHTLPSFKPGLFVFHSLTS